MTKSNSNLALSALIAQLQAQYGTSVVLINPTGGIEQFATQAMKDEAATRKADPRDGILVHLGSAIGNLRDSIFSARTKGTAKHLALASALEAELENAVDLYDSATDWCEDKPAGSTFDTFYRLPVTGGAGQWRHKLAVGFVDGGDGPGGLSSSIDRAIAFPGLPAELKTKAEALKQAITAIRSTAIAQRLA